MALSTRLWPCMVPNWIFITVLVATRRVLRRSVISILRFLYHRMHTSSLPCWCLSVSTTGRMVCSRISFSRLDSWGMSTRALFTFSGLSLPDVSLLTAPLSLSREKPSIWSRVGCGLLHFLHVLFLCNSSRDDSCRNKHNRALSPIRRTSFVPRTFSCRHHNLPSHVTFRTGDIFVR